MTTLRFQIILLLLIVTLSAYGQQSSNIIDTKIDSLAQTDSAKLENYFLWQKNIKKINHYNYHRSLLLKAEKNRDNTKLLEFLTNNYKIVKPIAGFKYKPKELVKYTYAVDLNADSLLDFIYVGPYSGDYNITQVFLNKNGQYKKVFSGKQELIKLDYSKNKLHSFTLFNEGCCADPGKVEHNYSVSFYNNKQTFNLKKTIGYYNETEKPQQLFSKEKSFTVKTDNAKLRFDCYVLDVEHPFYGINGNAIATYKPGSKGKALASKKDNNLEWVYVIMSADNTFDNCDFSTFKDQPTAIKGWILKSDINLK